MAARASSLALCALLALCLVSHAVSRTTNRGAAAPTPVETSAAVASEHGHGFPCGKTIAVVIPHHRLCDRRCDGLCVELFMWKYPDIRGVKGDCDPANAYQCKCTFYC